VSQGEDTKLFSKGLKAINVNWIPETPKNNKFECYAKFRYRQPDQKVSVEIRENDVLVMFDEPQRAVTQDNLLYFIQRQSAWVVEQLKI